MTAVEWLLEHLERNIMWTDEAEKIAEQAKEMEKQQIISFLKWVGDGYDFQNNAKEIVNEYYNETFKIK